jgi:ElaB/YqjD/DUF883 family membrane-anchored ribosome-binding protein
METRQNSDTAVGGTIGGIAGRAHGALDTAVEKVAPSVNRMVSKAHEAIDRVADRAGPAAESVDTAVRDAADSTARLAESFSETIRRQPLAAVGLALAFGYLLGRMRS